MDTAPILARVLDLARALDAALEAGRACADDDVYALAGLVIELDLALTRGDALPARWRPSVERSAPLLMLGEEPAANEVRPRRRRAVRHTQTPAAHQLALPFATGA